MVIPSSLLRGLVTITPVTETGIGVTTGVSTMHRCYWESQTGQSRSTPTDSAAVWVKAGTPVKVGDRVAQGTRTMTVTSIVEHYGPTGRLAYLQVFAS